ncbi:MAG: deoxyguanosinetriphosphate triphosphohydrolase [Rhodospirillaceae bacterium]|nr:deoxyguanosinetriphosphate triphosphohydrolase [Rhodospirillaceae bacterium]
MTRTPAVFATRPAQIRGRLYSEPESATRTAFQRDRDRIVHSAAFRRLEYKTQVFVYHEGDNYRTRLTHSLEVAQIARSISRQLGLDEDLAEALALAHDLGHTPFGHAGEDALDAAMAAFGGFDHNAQTLRIVTRLERKYADFDGLNLTWETLEGVVKHNGPLPRDGAPTYILEYDAGHAMELDTWPGAEAQVASLADDIAYNNHDIDDGLRADLFSIEALKALPMVGEVFAEVEARYPGLERRRLVHEAIRRLINRMVADLLTESRRRIEALAPDSVEAVRHLGQPLIGFSEEMRANDRALKTFLFENMYRHYRVNRMASKARRVIAELFDLLLGEPDCLPTAWRERAAAAGSPETARVVADYIAGMTDRYALEEHQRLFDVSAKA